MPSRDVDSMATQAWIMPPTATLVRRCHLMPHTEPAWTPELLDAPHDVPDKAGRVRRMFNGIAQRYELINSLFSMGRDASWRRRAVELAGACNDDQVLDIGCGTGDFARAFASAGAKTVIGCDFAHEMLVRAAGSKARATPRKPKPADQLSGMTKRSEERAKLARALMQEGMGKQVCPCRPTARSTARCSLWCEGDALRLPFRSGTFSITSCAFSVRNFADLDVGLFEMFRVLRRGGRAVILEFTRPKNRVARRLYEFYSHRFMPVAATLISRDRSGAYRYLPRSVVSFPSAEQMCSRLRRAGFDRTTATPLSMGIVTVYVAVRN